MTQRIPKMPAGPRASAPNAANQPIFFFDGDFRTWGQVEQRAQLNRAIAAHVSSSQLR